MSDSEFPAPRPSGSNPEPPTPPHPAPPAPPSFSPPPPPPPTAFPPAPPAPPPGYPPSGGPGGPGGYGQPGYGQVPAGPVKTYLAFAILTTLFCCLPFGVVAIVKSSQVNSKLAAGDYDGAVKASNQAKMWSLISLLASVVVGVIYFIAVGLSN